MISQSVIEQVRLRADISTVVGDYTTLQKVGSRLRCCCPFHNEKTPSFIINTNTNSWHCFGACSEGGDAIEFIRRKEGVSFLEAVRLLANKFHIPIEEIEDKRTEEQKQATLKKEAMLIVYQQVQKYYSQQIYKDTPAAKQALAYAESRWGKEFCRERGIGYATADWQGLVDFAKQNNLSFELLKELGLIAVSSKGKQYDFFRDRVMIPIRDYFGRVIGYTARTMIDNDTLPKEKRQPKYINSTTSLIYKKEKHVFGIDLASRTGAQQHTFYLVEGAPDVLRLQSIGITNAVACLGSDWTDEQFALLHRNADLLVFLPDADQPQNGQHFGTGILKVLKAGQRAYKQGFRVAVREIPLGQNNTKNDPDSYCKTVERFNDLEQVDFVLWYALKRRNCPEMFNTGRSDVKDIAALVSHLENPSDIDYTINLLNEVIKGKSMWRKAIEEAKRHEEEIALKKDKNAVSLELFEKFGFQEYAKTYISIGSSGKRIRWSNFVMKPLFHIRDNQSALRLFEIENEDGEKSIVEFKQEDLVSLTKFKQKVESLGNFVWLVKDEQLTRLKQYLYKTTETAELITQLGWQRKGFFAFGNGIFDGQQWLKADEYGIVRLGDKGNFYLPAFSTIYKNDPLLYQFERNFVHHNWQSISLRQYAEQLITCFGDNAKIGIAFLLATLFRDVVTAQTKSFPILNLFGPKGSGKSELGHSLMSFFIIENTPPNIQNSTLPALADTVAQCANALVHIDEFKNTIDIDKREFLKGLWDGTGRNRMNMDKDKKREVTRVDCGVILSGQEMATADIALFSRFIFLRYNKSEFSQEAKIAFQHLKDIRKLGCSHLTLEILKNRAWFESNFNSSFQKVFQDIQQGLAGLEIEDRILLNWLIPVAAFHCLHTQIDLTFDYLDLMQVARTGIIAQNGELKQNNEISVFWDIVNYLRQEGTICIGADYRLDWIDKLKVDDSNNLQEFIKPKKILYLRHKRIFELYQMHGKKSGDVLLPKNSLAYYLEHSQAYLGRKKSVRFKNIIQGRQMYSQDTIHNNTIKALEETTVDQAYCFDYNLIQEQFGISLEVSTISIENDETPKTDMSF